MHITHINIKSYPLDWILRNPNTVSKQNSKHILQFAKYHYPSNDEAQIVLFKDPVRTAQ
jgi:hypothetical protein